jgi:hypothetical protein
MSDGDHREQIVRLEAQIDGLTARIESCRKFILAGRIAVAGGGLVLIAMLVGAIQFDPSVMAVAVVAPSIQLGPKSPSSMQTSSISSMMRSALASARR